MGGDHPSIFIFIKHYAQFIEPLDGVRRFHDQPLQKFRPCGTGFICLNGCGSACAAAADHQYVHVIIHFVKVDFFP